MEQYAQAHGPTGIYKASQGGTTWRFLPIERSGIPESILVDPITTTRLYVGEGAGVHISENEGQSWRFLEIDPPDVYTDCRLYVDALATHRAHPGTILAGIWHDCGSYSRGSIYRSEDYGESWSPDEF